ncbi:MAG: hypothetical protein WBD20_07840 [Pirellulaceae bacterium]
MSDVQPQNEGNNPLVYAGGQGGGQNRGQATTVHQQVPQLKPTGVTVTGVIGLLAGLMGLLTGVLVIGQLLFAQQISDAFLPTGSEGQAQRDMNAALAAINAKYMIPHMISTIAGLTLSTCLLIGGIGCLRSSAWAPRWMRKTLLVIIIFEVMRMGFYVLLQFETLPVIQESMDAIANANAGNGGPPPAFMQSIQKVSMIVGFAMWGIWFILKMGLAFWGRRYLNREQVLAYFKRAPSQTR